MRTRVVVPPNPLTQEQFAAKLGVSRKRFLELKAIAGRAFAQVAGKRAADMGLTIPEYLQFIKTTPVTEAAQPQTAAVLTASEKTKRKAKVSSSGSRKIHASKPN